VNNRRSKIPAWTSTWRERSLTCEHALVDDAGAREEGCVALHGAAVGGDRDDVPRHQSCRWDVLVYVKRDVPLGAGAAEYAHHIRAHHGVVEGHLILRTNKII